MVLAETVPHIDTGILLITVGVGVGIMLSVCLLRIVAGVRLRWLFCGFYFLIFVLAFLSERNFLGVAFDSGGVTTGPMTVPFILALGIGISNARSDRNAEADSFGLVGLCSIGPILAVLALGFFYKNEAVTSPALIGSWSSTVEISKAYLAELPHCFAEIAVALSPIVIIFLVFKFTIPFSKRPGFFHERDD